MQFRTRLTLLLLLAALLCMAAVSFDRAQAARSNAYSDSQSLPPVAPEGATP